MTTEERLANLDRKVDRILFILEGDEKMHVKGLTEETAELKARVKKMEIKWDRALWSVSALAITGAAGLKELISKIFSSN